MSSNPCRCLGTGQGAVRAGNDKSVLYRVEETEKRVTLMPTWPCEDPLDMAIRGRNHMEDQPAAGLPACATWGNFYPIVTS
jgi:hypothetical protein